MSFEDWWSLYPRKVAKGAARRAYGGALRKADPKALSEGVARYVASLARQKADRGWAPEICHPATWLNSERWLDEYGPVADLPQAKVKQTSLDAMWAESIRKGLRVYRATDADVARLIRAGLVTVEQARRCSYAVDEAGVALPPHMP